LAKFPSGITSLGIKIVVLPLSPSTAKVDAVEIEMKRAGVGDGFLKSRFKIEGEIRLSQTHSSPMTIARRLMVFGEYLDGFSLPKNRLGWHTGLHLPSGRRACMAQA
jgi:hypothetical protein